MVGVQDTDIYHGMTRYNSLIGTHDVIIDCQSFSDLLRNRSRVRVNKIGPK